MNKVAVAEELVAVANDLVAAEGIEAAMGRQDFEDLAEMMGSTGVAGNRRFVDAMVKWLKGQNSRFDEDGFRDALK
jgi:hypothetical protein